MDSSALFLVQGTGQALNLPGAAWGNGFVTDKPTASAPRPHLLSWQQLVGRCRVCGACVDCTLRSEHQLVR